MVFLGCFWGVFFGLFFVFSGVGFLLKLFVIVIHILHIHHKRLVPLPVVKTIYQNQILIENKELKNSMLNFELKQHKTSIHNLNIFYFLYLSKIVKRKLSH